MRPISLKQLEAALKWKTRKDRGATKFRFEGFTLDYEGKDGIFDQARERLLPPFYRTRFPNTEEGHLQMADAIMDSVDAKLTTLEKYLKPTTSTQGIEEASMANAAAQPTEAVQQPVAAGVGAGGIPSLPSAGSVSPSPRIRIIQPPPTATPATDKANRLAKESPDTAKMERLQTAVANPNLKFKPGFGNTLRNFGSKAGTFFQRNVGKYLTVGRAVTGIGAVIGGFAGAGLTGGSSLGVLGGAVGGGILPSWFKSGGGGRFFGNLGNGAINSFSKLSNQISRPSFFKGASSKRIGLAFLGMFLLFAIGAGVIGGLIGGGGTSGVGGNVGVGTTAPTSPGGTQPAPITTTPGSFVYYCQNDPKFTDSCSYGWATCGPTSIAMIISTLGAASGLSMNPKQVDTVFTSNNGQWRNCGDEDTKSMDAVVNSSWFTGLGFKAVSLSTPLDLYQASQLLKEGALILGSVDIHIFVVDGVNPGDNLVHLRDPDKTCNPNGYWSSNNAPWNGRGIDRGWTYAYAIKKVR